ncbi:MAG: hypothetical protein ACFFD4_28050, partial [Candidatus Odinarchaeota archaeon]
EEAINKRRIIFIVPKDFNPFAHFTRYGDFNEWLKTQKYHASLNAPPDEKVINMAKSLMEEFLEMQSKNYTPENAVEPPEEEEKYSYIKTRTIQYIFLHYLFLRDAREHPDRLKWQTEVRDKEM